MSILDSSIEGLDKELSTKRWYEDIDNLKTLIWPGTRRDYCVEGWALSEYHLSQYAKTKCSIIGTRAHIDTQIYDGEYSLYIEPLRGGEERGSFYHTLVMQQPKEETPLSFSFRTYVRGYQHIIYCGRLRGKVGIWWIMNQPALKLYELFQEAIELNPNDRSFMHDLGIVSTRK